MIGSIWGNDPPNLVPQVIAPLPPHPPEPHDHSVYYNPRFTVYFSDYPPEMGQISDMVDYNLLGATLSRGEFLPTYDGPVSSPPAIGWSGDAHEPIRWNGADPIAVKMTFTISLGRQIFQQVDAELYCKKNGVEMFGIVTSSSLNRCPSGPQGSTTMNLTIYTTLNTGDEIEPLLRKSGNDPTLLTQINVFAAEVDITALKTYEIIGVSFP